MQSLQRSGDYLKALSRLMHKDWPERLKLPVDSFGALNHNGVGKKMATKMPQRTSFLTNTCVILQVHPLDFYSTMEPSYMFNVVAKNCATMVCRKSLVAT